MTVGADQSPGKKTLTGDGSNRVFDFSPVVIEDPGSGQDNHLEVTITDTNGVETIVTEGTGTANYSVALVADYPSTGSITYPATLGTALPATSTITIRRVTPKTQVTDFENQGGYFSETHEATFDRMQRQIIELEDLVGRIVKVPVSEDADILLPSVTERANKFLRFDANGDPDVSTDANPDIATIGVSAFWETVLDDTTADASLTTLGFSTPTKAMVQATTKFDARAAVNAAAQPETRTITNDDYEMGVDNDIKDDDGRLIIMDIGSADRTFTLPDVTETGMNAGWSVGVKLGSLSSAAKLIITRADSTNILGIRNNATVHLRSEDDVIWFTFSGSNWHVWSYNVAPITSLYVVDGIHTYATGWNKAYYKVIGGGGGGGGAGATSSGETSLGGGGGGGTHFEGVSSIPANTSSVTVGGGGAGGSGTSTGVTGGSTTIGSVVQVSGGTGGEGGTATSTSLLESGGAGGNSSTLTATFDWSITTDGQAGGNAYTVGAVPINTGDGGGTLSGPGPRAASGTSEGVDGISFGTGGSGASAAASQSAQDGGDGRNGIAIIIEYLF